MNQNHYLRASKQQLDWGFYLISCGSAVVEPGQCYPSKGASLDGVVKQGEFVKRSSFLLLYIAKGEGMVTIENHKLQHLKSGQCLLLEPNVKHNYQPSPKIGWTEYWIEFNGALPSQWIGKSFITEHPVRQLSETIEFEGAFQSFVVDIRERPLMNPFSTGGHILHILGRVLELSMFKDNLDRNQEQIGMLRYHIYVHSAEDINFVKLACGFGMSYSTLRRLFKAKYGVALQAFLIEERVRKAALLLENTALEVKEIARQVGFSSANYFTRSFTKHIHLSPLKYRKKAHKRAYKREFDQKVL